MLARDRWDVSVLTCQAAMTRPRSALVCGENESCTFHKQKWFETPKAAIHPCASQTTVYTTFVFYMLCAIYICFKEA